MTSHVNEGFYDRMNYEWVLGEFPKMPRGKSNADGTIKTGVNPFARGRSSDDGALFKDVPSLGLVIDSLLGRGAALVIGRTRNGDAVSITVLDGDERHRTYCHGQDDLDFAFRQLSEMYSG